MKSAVIGSLVALVLVSSTGARAWGGTDAAGPPVPLQVVVDIRPGICPNHLRLASPLTLPVAVLGDADLEATNIDPGSVRISREGGGGECSPARWGYADVGALLIGSSPDCNTPRGDGLEDLCLEFAIPDLVAMLGPETSTTDVVSLVVTGTMFTGRGIEGKDQAVLLAGRDPEAADDVGLLASAGEGTSGDVILTFYTNVSDRIKLAIYDSRGHAVAVLVDADRAPGIYRATWDRKDTEGRLLEAGDYFARLTNGQAGVTRRVVLAR